MSIISTWESIPINEAIAYPGDQVELPGGRTLLVTEWTPTVSCDGITVVIKGHIFGERKKEQAP